MDFSQNQQTAMLLAGTVALPSPFPSSGSLSVVVVPEAGDFEVFIKIVQIVSPRRIITRIVRLADIRAVKAPPPKVLSGGPETWPLLGAAAVRRHVDKIEKDLLEKVKRSNMPEASDWLPVAIVYVPESAPVLHRDEVGVTAAVSAEDVGFSPLGATCAHAGAESGLYEAQLGRCSHI